MEESLGWAAESKGGRDRPRLVAFAGVCRPVLHAHEPALPDRVARLWVCSLCWVVSYALFVGVGAGSRSVKAGLL